MSLNPGITKPAYDFTFTNKRNPWLGSPPLIFNNIPVKVSKEANHLGMLLDRMLKFENHINEKICKANSILGIMQQVKRYVSHKDLETIYKSYCRTNLDYGDVIFHKQIINNEQVVGEPHNDPYLIFHSQPSEYDKKIEKVQYEAAKILTGAWKRTSQEKLYKMLGWESLQQRRVSRKLCIIFETLETKSPNHFYRILKNQLPVGQKTLVISDPLGQPRQSSDSLSFLQLSELGIS